jgi:hypothetical protein
MKYFKEWPDKSACGHFFGGVYSYLEEVFKENDVEFTYIKEEDRQRKSMMNGFQIDITPSVLFFESDGGTDNLEDLKEVSRFYPTLDLTGMVSLIKEFNEKNKETETGGSASE